MAVIERLMWAIKWTSDNKLDGHTEHIIGGIGLLFPTRMKARTYIKEHYGYIRSRPDLRQEPHGWKMPKAVKVLITIGDAHGR